MKTNISHGDTKAQGGDFESLVEGISELAASLNQFVLFRSLCRYYYTLNPAATADYVFAYRDMWDSEEERMKVG